jgi:hypothetical protein
MQSPAKWIRINEKKLIADCIAAIQPDDLFVKKMVEEAKKLKDSGKVSADEFLAVSRSYLIQDMLMKETLGDPEAVNGTSIEEVLKKLRADAAFIPEQQLLTEKVKNQDLETQLRNYERDSIEKRSKLRGSVRNVATRFYGFMFIISMVLLAVSIVIPFLNNVSLIWKIFSVSAAIVCGICSVGYGFNLRGLKENIIDMTSEKVMLFMERRFLSNITYK